MSIVWPCLLDVSSYVAVGQQVEVGDVEVIGHALALGVVSGLGMRRVADRLGVPMTTAREWRRRFQLRAPAMAAALVAVAVHLDPVAVVLSMNGEGAALEVLGAAWQRARTRFGERVPAVWRFWSLISGGQALGTDRARPRRWHSEQVGWRHLPERGAHER